MRDVARKRGVAKEVASQLSFHPAKHERRDVIQEREGARERLDGLLTRCLTRINGIRPGEGKRFTESAMEGPAESVQERARRKCVAWGDWVRLTIRFCAARAVWSHRTARCKPSGADRAADRSVSTKTRLGARQRRRPASEAPDEPGGRPFDCEMRDPACATSDLGGALRCERRVLDDSDERVALGTERRPERRVEMGRRRASQVTAGRRDGRWGGKLSSLESSRWLAARRPPNDFGFELREQHGRTAQRGASRAVRDLHAYRVSSKPGLDCVHSQIKCNKRFLECL